MWKADAAEQSNVEKKTFESKPVSYSNPGWNLPNQSTMSVSVYFSAVFCEQQAERQTLSA